MKKRLLTLLMMMNLAACSTSSSDEIAALRAQLNEKDVTIQLSAQNTEKLQKTYTDMYFELDSLTVDSFQAKVARGDTFYAYIGRPSCGDCQSFEPLFKRYIREHRLNGRLYFVNVHFLQQDKAKWAAFKQQYQLKGTPTLAKYSRGKMVNKLDYEENGGITTQDIEKWLAKNKL